MNLLGLIFGLLLIYACAFSLSLHKSSLSGPVEISCQNHLKATRKILNSYETEYYKTLSCQSEKKAEKKEKAPHQKSQSSSKAPPPLNGECSHLNLWPLITEEKNEHPALYETAAQLLRTFYQQPLFGNEARIEYALLDALLDAARKEKSQPNFTTFSLEKLVLKDKNVKRLYPLQSIYYRMLKGTKSKTRPGYPSLMDYFSFDSKESTVCLRHASPEMLSALFGSKAAATLYTEIHENKITLSKERILEICKQSGLMSLSDDFLELLDLRSVRHRLSSKKILVENEGDVSLRKKIFLPSV